MRLPWKAHREVATERLAFSVNGEQFAWAVADVREATPRLLRFGVQALPVLDEEGRARAVRALALPGAGAIGVLPLTEYQMLQIDAPPVPADELKAAARWRIKDMVKTHVDEVTLDVMHVGAHANPSHPQLFVVAATNEAIQASTALALAGGLQPVVIDVVDTTQRNLHTRAAAALDLTDRATACLMVHGQLALLTVCIGDELYYSRRLEWDAGLLHLALPGNHEPGGAAADEPPASASLDTDGLSWSGDAMAYELGAPEEAADRTPRLVVELQRSFDVWERSWPDQPVVKLLLHAGESSDPLAAYLQNLLGLRVKPLDLARALPGAEIGGGWSGREQACLPLLGALLRTPAPR